MFCRPFQREGARGSVSRKSARRFGVPGNASSNSVRRSLSCRVSSRHTRKIKSSYHVYLSSFHDKYPLSGSRLPVLPFPPHSDADDSGTVSVDATQHDDAFFGPVPSEIEIQNALSSLQQVFGSASRVKHVRNICYCKLDSEVGEVPNTPLVNQVSSDGPETDWKEPSLSSYNPRMLQADGSDKAAFAIHLLQNDTFVQRMVNSLSSDKSVWEAVLNNEVVRELRKAITSERDRSSNGMDNNDSPNAKNVIMRLSDAAKAKLMEAFEKITKLVKKLFQSARRWKAAYEGKSNSFKDRLRVSVMLSIMIFLIVVVDRLY
ncbi:hypothetical protein E2542_SST10901 [Spatholobus suberectus]|nr:hypothetical protein E2542_SST10901 [Spatholobus suberectus]